MGCNKKMGNAEEKKTTSRNGCGTIKSYIISKRIIFRRGLDVEAYQKVSYSAEALTSKRVEAQMINVQTSMETIDSH